MQSDPSRAFELLHPAVQRWIWERKWSELRDAQERTIPIILEGTRDVVIAATTASGKTEAAFLPIVSRLLNDGGEGLALYVSPLKALINDLRLRLEELFGIGDMPVYPWHGDIAASKKTAFERNPRGALLITPESLESIFVRKGFYLPSIFQHLQYVVVDELHSFINTERGMQLMSLLQRLEATLARRVPRVGLSATLGDKRIAADFLRPNEGAGVEVVESKEAGQEIRVLVKGYCEPFASHSDDEATAPDKELDGLALVAVTRDLFNVLQGSKNLVFANSRRRVEEFTDRLVRLCEDQGRPNEFYAHHGSLSKVLREEVEEILKESDRPATAVCTSSLEMGIDIGQVRSVAQIDAPFSVASLRQRLGRSGRRGEPAILRMYVTELELHSGLAPQDTLRLDLFQAVAATQLLLQKWCEPPTTTRLHLSTLIQQILSLIAQYGGLTAEDAWQITCKSGPFREVDQAMFADVLRGLGQNDLIMQAPDGTLLHSSAGEHIVNHYSFYTAFWTSDEFKLVHGHNVLGSLPVSHPIPEKSLILFAGRRWRVVSLDDQRKVIEVVPAQGGRAPHFSGGGGIVHRRVHEEMKRLYSGVDRPAYLDSHANQLLSEGREQFARHTLASRSVVPHEGGCLLFLWAGDTIANTVLGQLRSLGLTGLTFGVGLVLEDVTPEQLRSYLHNIVNCGPADSTALADSIPNQIIDRYDEYLRPELLSANYASGQLDPRGAWECLGTLSY